MDSGLFEIEALLATRGLGRKRSETTSAWASRLGRIDKQFAGLDKLVELHYQQRFYNQAMSPEIRSRFAQLVKNWLTEHPVPPGS